MPDAADVVAAADTLVEVSLFEEAIHAYTKAIALAPTAPQYYIKRYSLLFRDPSHCSSTAYQRSGNVEAALKVLARCG